MELEAGRWYIDTNKKVAVTLVCLLVGSDEVCVVKTDEGDPYLVMVHNLIPYDKYYFD